MKTILAFLILFCVFTSPTFAELTDADLNKIRLIVTEEIQKEITPIKADIATLKADIATLKTDMAVMKADIVTLKTDMAVMKTEVANLKETFNSKFDDIQKNFDRQNNIIIACIGIPMAILAIGATVWGILAHRRSGKDHEQERINQELREEIETLKQQLVTRP